MLLLILLPNGSVEYQPFHLLATGFFAVAALASLICPTPPPVRVPAAIAISVAAALALWMIIQALGFSGNPFANPIWNETETILGPMSQSISVAPGDTVQGLVAALLPFAVFIAALLLFGDERQCLWLMKAVVVCGAILAVIGLVQFELFPDSLLLDRKNFYLQSLTVVFVNANTAATYLAMLLVFTVGLAFHAIQNAGFRQLLRWLIGAPSSTRGTDARAGLLYSLLAALFFVSLLLTKSRAGVGSGIAGVILLGVILAYHGSQHLMQRSVSGFGRRRTARSTKLLRAGLVVTAILVIGAIFSGQVMMRAQVQGSNDLRFCFMPGVLQMVRDNWLTGTGFGSFRYVFPAYRDPSCGLEGAFTRAHDFFLEGWITLGLPFVLLASLVITSLFFYFIKGIQLRRQYRWVPAAAMSVLLIQMLHNSIDFSIQIPAVAAVFAALMGAGIVAATGRAATGRAATGGAAGRSFASPADAGSARVS